MANKRDLFSPDAQADTTSMYDSKPLQFRPPQGAPVKPAIQKKLAGKNLKRQRKPKGPGSAFYGDV